MATVVLFTVAIGVDETPSQEECAKLRAKMETASELVFGNVELVEAHVEQESPAVLRGYHVTGQVTLVVDVNSYIKAASEELARQQFTESVSNGLDVSVINYESIDIQDKPEIVVDNDIDIIDIEEADAE